MNITLRDVEDHDIDVFFAHHNDKTAQQMAAFTSPDPTNKQAFIRHWNKLRKNHLIITRAVLVDGMAMGSMMSGIIDERREVGYWIDRAYWGQGITTHALKLFLIIVEYRPLFAVVAKHNIASQRVLEKCGFTVVGEDKGFAHAYGHDVDEYILKLE